jgi:hypothetical protein
VDWATLVVGVATAAAGGILGYIFGGRRAREDRLRQFKVLQLDQTLDYVLAYARAALTVLAYDTSEEPFDKLRAARSLPWRSPLALAETGKWVELLDLAGRYTGMSRDELLALSPQERKTASERIVFLKVVVAHEAAKQRKEILG